MDGTSLPERWRAVPGFEDAYEVSDLGHVRSVDRSLVDALGRPRRVRGKLLATKIGYEGYVYINLYKDSRRHQRRVHSLVLASFVGLRPWRMVCRHGIGGPADNRLVNLQWGTPRENNYDTSRHGHHRGKNKYHCRRGHLLQVPNLVSSAKTRRCLACTKATKKQHYETACGRPFDIDLAAASYYRKIMDLTTAA